MKFKKFTKRNFIVHILLLITTGLCTLLYSQLKDINAKTYAYTFSFGNGYGFTHYTESFEALPDYLKRSVELHESVHLEDGVFTDENKAEVKAYSIQIETLEKELNLERYQQKINPTEERLIKIHNMLDFINGAKFNRSLYETLK